MPPLASRNKAKGDAARRDRERPRSRPLREVSQPMTPPDAVSEAAMARVAAGLLLAGVPGP
eukprot:11499138-Heterocapsa_arctica.AAC.1